MFNRIGLLIIILLSISSAWAQTPIATDTEIPNISESLIVQHKTFGTKYLLKGEEEIKLDIFVENKRLANIFQSAPAADVEFKMYVSLKRKSEIVKYIGYAVLVFDILWIMDYDGAFSPKDRDEVLTKYLTVAAIGSGINIIGVINSFKAENHLHKAVALYNNSLY